MNRHAHQLLAAACLLAAALACAGPPAPGTPGGPGATTPAPAPTVTAAEGPRPARVLSIAFAPRYDPPPTPDDVVAAIDMAHDAGARGGYLSWKWTDLEPEPGVLQVEDLRNTVHYLGAVRGFELLVGIQVLNTTVKETPSDLAEASFDSPEMKRRFRALMNAVLPHLNRHVRYLSIGNEVDGYLAFHPDEWPAYKSFYDDAVAHVHSAAPWIQVGVTITFNGATGPAARQVADLNESSDVYILTYYPLNADFSVQGPDAPLADLPRMVALTGGRPLVLQEVGYPTADILASSPAKQADFVRYVFEAWEAAGEAVPFLSFFALHDFSEDICDEAVAYYDLFDDNTNFKAYLCTLGLRHMDGRPKAGWETFVSGAAAMP